MRSETKSPDVFIIESLGFDDEERGHSEGQFLAHVLRLAGRDHKYFYIRTKRELEEVLDKFDTSGFRYLHVSCHANSKGVGLTLDSISVSELGKLLRPYLHNRRVFFSACELATEKLASALLLHSGCYSVIAPSKTIGFGEAALFWASLYHLMFKDDQQVMKRDELARHLSALSSLFRVEMRYFSSSRSDPRGFTEIAITPSLKRQSTQRSS